MSDPARVPALDLVLTLPEAEGGTRCHVGVRSTRGRRPLVVVTELADNPGHSISLAFDAISRRVREMLPPGSVEPLWLERWPGRALAALVLHDRTVPSVQLLRQHAGQWQREPLSNAAVADLLGRSRATGGTGRTPRAAGGRPEASG